MAVGHHRILGHHESRSRIRQLGEAGTPIRPTLMAVVLMLCRNGPRMSDQGGGGSPNAPSCSTIAGRATDTIASRPSRASALSTAPGPSARSVSRAPAHLQEPLALCRQRGVDPVGRHRRQARLRPDDRARSRSRVTVGERPPHHGARVALELLRDGLEVREEMSGVSRHVRHGAFLGHPSALSSLGSPVRDEDYSAPTRDTPLRSR